MSDLLTQNIEFIPTRKAGLERLALFAPFAGSKYTAERNFDYGSNDRSNVSALSPWVRHRLITEEEICAHIMQHFALYSTEKFIQEVFWRTYWKGWLELRPSVWTKYNAGRMKAFDRLEKSAAFTNIYDQAINGATGIDCFDKWAKELTKTGYLHNHARMWFASIWIFTLRLDWHLGADFFLRNLMDADAASNTLSWRWVGGLQTKGKHYVARADNIFKFTKNRIDAPGLNESARPLPDDGPFDPPIILTPHRQLPDGQKALVLIGEDDCTAEHLHIGRNKIAAIAVWNLSAERSPLEIGTAAKKFTQGALDDAGARAAKYFGLTPQKFEGKNAINEIVSLAAAQDVDCVITSYTPRGWARAPMDHLKMKLEENNIAFYENRREWDSRAWPHATKGFFPFKEKIPKFLTQSGFDITGKR